MKKANNKRQSDLESSRSIKSSISKKSSQTTISKNPEEGKGCINGFYNIIQFTKSLFVGSKEEAKKK